MMKNSETYKLKVQVFKEGTVEDWIQWQMDVKDFFVKLNAGQNTIKQHQIYSSLLTGKAKEDYVANYNAQNDAKLGFASTQTQVKQTYFAPCCQWHRKKVL